MAGWAIYILAVKRNVLKTGEQYLMKFTKPVMLTENYVKAGNVMGNKYSRLQISIHWLVFAGYCSVLRNGVSGFLPT